ncbi:MAG: ceramidase domain-containing protein [Gammaproteobacteria bacterium]
MTNNPFYIALSITGLFTVVFFYLSSLGLIQSKEEAYLIGEASRWCERVSDGWFREPVNTLSNFGFVFVGLIIFWIISNENTSKNNLFFGVTGITLIYATAAVYLGPGSMLMHATNTEWGGWADNLSMVMYIVIPWLYNISLMAKWSIKKFVITYFVIIISYAVLRWLYGWGLGIGFNLFGTSIGLWFISEALYRFWSHTFRFLSGFLGFFVMFLFGTSPLDIFNNISDYWWTLFFWLPGLLATHKPEGRRSTIWFILGMISYFLAFAIWTTGVPDHQNCSPDSIIQAHGIWHLLTALATFLFFIHYRSEQKHI